MRTLKKNGKYLFTKNLVDNRKAFWLRINNISQIYEMKIVEQNCIYPYNYYTRGHNLLSTLTYKSEQTLENLMVNPKDKTER